MVSFYFLNHVYFYPFKSSNSFRKVLFILTVFVIKIVYCLGNVYIDHACENNLEEVKNGNYQQQQKDVNQVSRDARNQPTQTEEIFSCHPSNSLSHIQVTI